MKRLIATAKYRRKPAGTELRVSQSSRRALLALGMAVEEEPKPVVAAPTYARRDMRAAGPAPVLPHTVQAAASAKKKSGDGSQT